MKKSLKPIKTQAEFSSVSRRKTRAALFCMGLGLQCVRKMAKRGGGCAHFTAVTIKLNLCCQLSPMKSLKALSIF